MGFSPIGVAVLVSIRAGEEEQCSEVLQGINTDAANSITIDFAKQNITHFARFVILDDFDQGEGRKRILFSAIFDGSIENFFAMLRDCTSDLDAIWGCCEGYTGASNFVQFMMQHNNKTGTILRGHRYDTVQNIQKYLALRDELAQKFDVPITQYEQVIQSLPRKTPNQVRYNKLLKWTHILLRNTAITLLTLPKVLGLLRFGEKLFQVRKVLNQELELKREYTDAPIDKSPPCREFGDGDEVVSQKENDALDSFLDRQMVQNQMTVVTVNDPDDFKLSEATLAYIGTLVNLPFINRNSMIPTIHFGRWLMIDNGKRMLFLSNYDGNWQTYIGDFVDKSATGLDAFWRGS
ncbi:MAG: hypothetical protein AAFV93_22695, partial [Chloroflexota bacterium]